MKILEILEPSDSKEFNTTTEAELLEVTKFLKENN